LAIQGDEEVNRSNTGQYLFCECLWEFEGNEVFFDEIPLDGIKCLLKINLEEASRGDVFPLVSFC